MKKLLLGKKNMQSFFSLIMLDHSILFAPFFSAFIFSMYRYQRDRPIHMDDHFQSRLHQIELSLHLNYCPTTSSYKTLVSLLHLLKSCEVVGIHLCARLSQCKLGKRRRKRGEGQGQGLLIRCTYVGFFFHSFPLKILCILNQSHKLATIHMSSNLCMVKKFP